MTERRLIAIDAETVLQLEEIAIDLDVMNQGDRRGFDILRSILAAWDEGERATGLRRGHLADLEVIEAILRSDPREEASEYAANPRIMADAVRNMIEDPDLHNPESPGPIVFEVDPAPQEAE